MLTMEERAANLRHERQAQGWGIIQVPKYGNFWTIENSRIKTRVTIRVNSDEQEAEQLGYEIITIENYYGKI